VAALVAFCAELSRRVVAERVAALVGLVRVG